MKNERYEMILQECINEMTLAVSCMNDLDAMIQHNVWHDHFKSLYGSLSMLPMADRNKVVSHLIKMLLKKRQKADDEDIPNNVFGTERDQINEMISILERLLEKNRNQQNK